MSGPAEKGIAGSEGACGHRTRIKCCGMFRDQDIAAVNRALPDYCGFVVDFPRSHRSLTPERATQLAGLLDARVKAVAVVVDQPLEALCALAATGAFHALQLHGHETADDVRAAQAATGLPVIRAFRVRGADDLLAARESPADLVLLDNGQGTGERFDWSLVRGFERPFMLAGGLTPANVAQAIGEVAPWGVDLSSGLETNHLKDPDKIYAAVAAVRSA